MSVSLHYFIPVLLTFVVFGLVRLAEKEIIVLCRMEQNLNSVNKSIGYGNISPPVAVVWLKIRQNRCWLLDALLYISLSGLQRSHPCPIALHPSLLLLGHLPTSSSLKITDRSFRYASSCL